MVELVWEESFVKKVKKLLVKNPDITDELIGKIQTFSENPFNPILRTHKLSGKLKDYWAFSINYTYRIVFRFSEENKIYFINIGTHDEVY